MASISFQAGQRPAKSLAKAELKPSKQKTVSRVALEYIQTTKGVQKLVLKPVSLSLQTVNWWNSGLSPQGLAVSRMVKDTQRVIGISSIPSSAASFSKDLSHLKQTVKKRCYKDIAKATAKVGISGAGLSRSLISLVEAGCGASLYSLNRRNLSILKGIGTVAQGILLGSSIAGFVKYVGKIREVNKSSPDLEPQKKVLVNSREKVLYIAAKILEKLTVISLMVLSLLAILAGIAAAAWIFLSLSALGLMVSIGTYFYEQIATQGGEKVAGFIDQ